MNYFNLYVKYKTKYLELKNYHLYQKAGGAKDNNKLCIRNMKFYDENNNLIDNMKNELKEQILCKYFIEPIDVVLELGARYGTVSCIINKKLNNKNNQVSVEPDVTIISALEKNIKNNNCSVNLIKGAISKEKLQIKNNSYGTRTFLSKDNSEETYKDVEIYDLYEIQKKYKLKFNVLVADCEGCLENFFKNYPDFINQLDKLILEIDRKNHTNYDLLFEYFYKNKFINIVKGHQSIWLNKKCL